MKNFLKGCTLLITLISFCSFSQTSSSDLALWSSIGVNYSPVKKLKFGLEQHLRLKEQAVTIDEYFTELSVKYEFFKNFEIGGGVRFIKENDNVGNKQGFRDYFRYNIDISYSHDIKRFEIGYRIRYQNKREVDLPNNETDTPTENIRFKTSIKYKIKKWPLDPKFSAEVFSRRGDGELVVSDASLSKYRLTLGTEYDFKKFGELGAYFRYQENTNNLESIKVIGLKYTYSIK
jgi:hypothetical protein